MNYPSLLAVFPATWKSSMDYEESKYTGWCRGFVSLWYCKQGKIIYGFKKKNDKL